MRDDHATAEADRGRDDECADGELTASIRLGEEAAGDASGARAPVVTTCAKPRDRTESIAASVPPPRYNSTSMADGTLTGTFL